MLPMPLGVERIPDDEKPEECVIKIKITFKLIFYCHNHVASILKYHLNSNSCDLKMKASIEGVVIKWTRRLADVIGEESTRIFNQNSPKSSTMPDEPGPIAELEFWDTRLGNLEYIYTQLRDTRIKKMAAILEKTQSVFYPCYMKMFRDCVGGSLKNLYPNVV